MGGIPPSVTAKLLSHKLKAFGTVLNVDVIPKKVDECTSRVVCRAVDRALRPHSHVFPQTWRA